VLCSSSSSSVFFSLPLFRFLLQSSSSCCLKLTSCITKLSPFLYILVLASLDAPAGAPGDPWSARVLRFAPILSLSRRRHILHHKAPSISIHSRLGVFGHARRSSWWSVGRTPARAGAKVRSYPFSLSLRGGGLKWSARLVTLTFSLWCEPCYACIKFRVM
jgi:hypothetical protein